MAMILALTNVQAAPRASDPFNRDGKQKKGLRHSAASPDPLSGYPHGDSNPGP